MTQVHLRNVLVLLGLVVTILGLVYFATEFFDVISDWGRVVSLVLLAILFVSLGLHFEGAADQATVVERSGWRWLKVTNALYILGGVTAFSAVLAFFAVDGLDRVWKVLVTLAVGLGLLLAAAGRVRRREEPPAP